MSRRRFTLLISRRDSVWLRASYAAYYGAIGSFMPFLALYFRSLDLSGLQIGVLAAVLPVGAAFLAPLWGALADAYSAHRLALRAALLVAAGVALLLARASAFPVLLGLMLLLSSAIAAIPGLLDSYAMTIAERGGRNYGQLRVWGSFGFIATVVVVGAAMGQVVSNAFLYSYSGALLTTFVTSFGLPSMRPRSGQSMWRGVADIVRNRTVLLLLFTAFLVGSNASIMFNYFGIYLTEIGGGTRLVGIASSFSAVSELPVLFFGTALLTRFSSRKVLVFAVGAYVLRFALYSVPPSPNSVLLVQLLHGVSYGAFLMASVTLIHELAGRERAATGQGLLSSMSLGFGSITGSLVGGQLLDYVGAVGAFRVATVGMIVALVVCIVTLGRDPAGRAQPKQLFGPTPAPVPRRTRGG